MPGTSEGAIKGWESRKGLSMGDRLAHFRQPSGEYRVPSTGLDPAFERDRKARMAVKKERGEYASPAEEKAARMRGLEMRDWGRATSWGAESNGGGMAKVSGRAVNALALHQSDEEPVSSWRPDGAQNYDTSLNRIDKAPPIGVVKKILRDDREAKRGSAAEAGTSEGARKGRETRKGGVSTGGEDSDKSIKNTLKEIHEHGIVSSTRRAPSGGMFGTGALIASFSAPRYRSSGGYLTAGGRPTDKAPRPGQLMVFPPKGISLKDFEVAVRNKFGTDVQGFLRKSEK